jgi:hypothetical protein
MRSDKASDDHPVTDDIGTFALDIETGWDPPSPKAQRRFVASLLMDAINALTAGSGGPMTRASAGEPRWRVTLREAGSVLATSRWSTDYQAVEATKELWSQRVETLSASAVRSQAHRWLE